MPSNDHKRRRIVYDFPIIVIIVTLIMAIAVMLLWNAILPDVLRVSRITYGQALGLLVLCRILFSGFRPFGGRPPMTRGAHWRNKWMHMTPEERQHFQEEWKRRCNPPKKDEEGKGSEV